MKEGRTILIAGSRLGIGRVEKALDAARASLVKPESLELEEIAAAIDFFASDEARQVTGQTFYFGGGALSVDVRSFVKGRRRQNCYIAATPAGDALIIDAGSQASDIDSPVRSLLE